MSAKLREAAELRMANPEASMSELAAQSGLTKSGLTHRFKNCGYSKTDRRSTT